MSKWHFHGILEGMLHVMDIDVTAYALIFPPNG